MALNNGMRLPVWPNLERPIRNRRKGVVDGEVGKGVIQTYRSQLEIALGLCNDLGETATKNCRPPSDGRHSRFDWRTYGRTTNPRFLNRRVSHYPLSRAYGCSI